MSKTCRLVGALLFLSLFSQAASADKWRYEITPYLWTAGMDGEIGPPRGTSSVDISFSDYVKYVDAGFAFVFEARSDKWAYGVDLLLAKLSEGLDLPATTLDAEVKELMFEGWLGYRPDAWSNLRVVGGIRYWDLDTKLDFVGLPATIKIGDSFADPFVGLEYRRQHGKWELALQGDVGGGLDADFTWGVIAGVSYRFSERWSTKFAYRFMDVDFESDELVMDLRMEGLMLGVGYIF